MSIRPVHHKSNIYLEESCDFHPLKKSIREIHVREIARRMSLLSFWTCMKSVKFISTVPSHTEVNSSSENALSYWLHAPPASFLRGGDVSSLTCIAYGTSQFPRFKSSQDLKIKRLLRWTNRLPFCESVKEIKTK